MRERGGKDKGKRQENKGTEVSKSNMHKTQLYAIFVDIPLIICRSLATGKTP